MTRPAKKIKTYDEATLVKAAKEVRDGVYGLRKAAKRYGIPDSTLSDRVQGGKSAKQHFEKSRALNPDSEEQLMDWIEKECDRGTTPRACDILEEAQQYANLYHNPVILKSSWIKCFKDRQKNLKARTTTDKCKLSQFYDFYGTLEHLTAHNPEIFVWSMGGVRLADYLGTWTNVIECISMSGDYCPPFILFNGGQNELDNMPELKTWKSELHPFNIKSPSTSQETMAVSWLTKVFQPYTVEDAQRLLIMDYRYLSEEFLNLSQTLHIQVLVLPPDSQYVAQPLESQIVQPLKSQFQRLMLKKKATRRSMLLNYSASRDIIFIPSNIKKSFIYTGLNPVSISQVLSHPLLQQVKVVYESKQQLAAQNNELFIEEVGDQRKGPPQNPDPEKFPDFEEFPGSPLRGPLGEVWIKGQTTDDERSIQMFQELREWGDKMQRKSEKIAEKLVRYDRGEIL